MPPQRVLVVDDEADILELVDYNLSRNGFETTCVASGEAALADARRRPPDLVVLDLMLPGLSGLEVCRVLKADPRTRAVPVLMLTARGEESDIVRGLEMGADDYVTKPFSPRVLIARVRALLRRNDDAGGDDAARIQLAGIQMDPGRHEAFVDGSAMTLTATEFRILHLLLRRPGWVFTRQQIIDRVQGEDVAVTLRSVDVHVVSLRRKLGARGDVLETVRGVGYRLRDPGGSAPAAPEAEI